MGSIIKLVLFIVFVAAAYYGVNWYVNSESGMVGSDRASERQYNR